MADELIYYENRIMKKGFSSNDFVENEIEAMKQMGNIAEIIRSQFNFKKVIFEGYYDKTQIDNNSIWFFSGQGNKMIIQLNEQDNLKCDAIKFKNKSGSIVNLIVKEKNEQNVDVFILRPTGGSQGSASLQYCFDEIGLATTWYNSYKYGGTSYLKNTFNFTLLEKDQQGSEAFGSPISYIDSKNINYIYSPLYYINNKQMTAIQRGHPIILEAPEDTGFIWNQNFKIKDTIFNKQYSTNKVWNFNFAENDLWLWDGFDEEFPGIIAVGYNKEKQILRIRNGKNGNVIQELNNIDMNNYRIYYLKRNLSYNLEKGVNAAHREMDATEDLTISRLFNDEPQTEIIIRGNCVLNHFQLDFSESGLYSFEEDYITFSSPYTHQITPDWKETPSSFFNNLYYEETLEYVQQLPIQAQTYDNGMGNNFTVPPGAVMTAINWIWSIDHAVGGDHYKWSENINSSILLNFSILINNFVSSTPPQLTKASVLQDNYFLSPTDWETYVRLSNIQIFITTPPSLQLPEYFSLLEGQDTFKDPRNIYSNIYQSDKKYTNAWAVLYKANKNLFFWNYYKTNFAPIISNYYSNITFAATSLKTKQELSEFAMNWSTSIPTFSRKSTARYGLILKKIK